MFSLKMLNSSVNLISLGKLPGFRPIIFTRLYRMLKLISPDVINAHHAGLLYSAPFILLNIGVRTFYTVHSPAHKDAPGFYSLFYKLLFAMRRVRLVPNSKSVFYSTKKKYGKRQDNYVYLGIEKPQISEHEMKVRKEVDGYKPSNQTKILINIARIAREKNQRLLLQAFLELINAGYDAVLLVIGSIQDENEFRELQELHHPAVHFLGSKDNVADYLASADLFCLTSHYEGLSLATIEAMSMKVIPVCTPVGALPEVVEDGFSG